MPVNNISMLGKKFGRVLIISDAGLNKHRKYIWNCLCDCGTYFTTVGARLRRGDTLSCGCLNSEIISKRSTIDIKNKRFGKVVVIERAGTNKKGKATWKCKCDCGNIFITLGKYLRNGDTGSCGCSKASMVSLTFLKYLEDYYGIQLEKEYKIEHKYYDGRYKNILIETDGTFWHASKKRKINDEFKTHLVKDKGFILIRIKDLNKKSQILEKFAEHKNQFDQAFL